MAGQRRGRQTISMEKMTNESNLQVTFSKRRGGLFKKASELCTLCGVQVAMIIFSPGQKVFSFGHPSVDDMVNKYINNVSNTNPLLVNQPIEAPHNASTINALNEELTGLQNDLDIEVARAQYLESMGTNNNFQALMWWDVTNKNELTFQQLELLKTMMETLQNRFTNEVQNIILEAERVNMAYQPTPINPFDSQANALFASFPNDSTNGAGPSVTNQAPYHPSSF